MTNTHNVIIWSLLLVTLITYRKCMSTLVSYIHNLSYLQVFPLYRYIGRYSITLYKMTLSRKFVYSTLSKMLLEF